MKKIPNVHNNWGRLKEVWLGDVWPEHFYDDLEPSIRDSFYTITKWTKEDLSIIEAKLKELGVTVLRPYVDGPKELYVSRQQDIEGKLLKPPITPRDSNAVIGNKLFFRDWPAAYEKLLDQYDPSHVFRHPGCNVVVSGANLVKLGRDLVMDYWDDKADDDIVTNKQWVFERYKSFMQSENKMLGKDYRLYFATQGGHCDGCFMPLREGLLIATHYYEDYEMLFPGWKKIILSNPTFRNFRWGNKASHRWHVPGLTAGAHFNEYLEKYCGEWIGNFEETYFEVNILVIDDKNILCIGDENKSNPIVRELKKYGITVHWVPFRTRTFWDGGLHCITLDTIREGTLEDYYPDRGSYGVKTVSSKFFDYSAEKFYAEYSNWLLTGKIIDTN